jgi:hypothetical protein
MLVEDTKAKYSVYNINIHNFDKTGFWIGVISLIKTVIGTRRNY